MVLRIYIYLYLSSLSLPLWASLRLPPSRVTTSRLRSGAYMSSGSSVTPRGFPCRILPSLGARESLRLLLYQPLSSPPHHLLYAARRLSRDEDGRPNRLVRFSTVFRALSASALWPRAPPASRLADARVFVPPFPLLPSRLVVRAQKSHAGAFAPPAPLRVTGICKSIYL